MSEPFQLDGGCTCRAIRYRMTTKPSVVHCRQCTGCRRETGAAFVRNALAEAGRLELR